MESHPYHTNQIIDINDWYKEYKKLAKHFDPRENYQAIYHFEEMGMILKKEKYQLEEIGRGMDEAFDTALNYLFNKIRSLKEYFNEYLWKDFIAIYDRYDELANSFAKFKKLNKHNEIYEEMKTSLANYFKSGNLKEYFDKVFTGYYDEQVYNKYLNVSNLIEKLKRHRSQLEEGIKKFDAQEFHDKWVTELNQFINSLKLACDGLLFKEVKLDFHSPKSPKIIPYEKSFTDPSKITCLANLGGFSSAHIAGIAPDNYITVSEDRIVRLMNPMQNFRITKTVTCGDFQNTDGAVTSFLLLRDESKPKHNTPFFVLLGGDDDHPSLDLWDCFNNKRLCCHEEAHQYRVSTMKLLKREAQGNSQHYYIATGSADGYIKVWVVKITPMEKLFEFTASIEMKQKVLVHDDFISSFVVVPKSEGYPCSVLISVSFDKCINFWEWERQMQDTTPYLNGHPENLQNGELLENVHTHRILTEVQIIERYTKKLPHAHSDRINAIVLISDQPDYSDLDFFATGGGDGNVIVWDLRTRKMVKTFSNTKTVFTMEYLKNNRIACSANDSNRKSYNIYIWDWKKSSLLLSIRDHKARIQRIIAIDKDIFASCDRDKIIKVWQLEN